MRSIAERSDVSQGLDRIGLGFDPLTHGAEGLFGEADLSTGGCRRVPSK
jgi:hypothetical protein